SALRWFGRQYHWVRVVEGEVVQIDRKFEQDIFDFKTTLACLPDGSWAKPDDATATRHTFEIRSRFGDSLKAPYWRAHWGTLPDPATVKDGQTRAAIARYNRTAEPGYLLAYLTARVHALRWVEENVRFKNREIVKPPLDLDELVNFSLGVDDVRTAAIDFLKLDQHIKGRNWISEHLMPPAGRVGRGRTIPLSRVMPVEGQKHTFCATIDLSRYHLDAAALASVCSFGIGDFVRLCEHPDGSPNSGHRLGQLLYGYTCTIQHLDWESGEIVLSVIPGNANHYRLASFGKDVCIPHAALNESVSDFVGGRVEQRLDSGLGVHIDRWFDRMDPRTPEQSPPDDITLRGMRNLLESIRLDGGYGYNASQVDAVLDGLTTRVQALQGPPGTGKTTTTALATLLRILARRQVGDVVLIAANTHTAVDTLLAAIERLLPEFERRATANGMRCPAISLNKAHSTNPPIPTGGIGAIGANKPLTPVQKLMKDSVVVIGGTTAAILKLVAEMTKGAKFKNLPEGFQTPLLVVDEASMLVFPHFLALATQVAADGEIMLAGDQRQLAPIVAHDWDNEDRPPVLLYQPHLSAIEMVQCLADAPGMSRRAIRRSALNHTFRLPGVVRELVARLYQRDGIDLCGNPTVPPSAIQAIAGDWGWIWEDAAGLFLVLHDEHLSRQSNPLEVEIIRRILAAGGELADGSIAIVTPHRAQRTLLRHELADYTDGPVDVIDVVEKLQGDERPTVIVSGTASDATAISATAEFILGLNRSNVAFSRPRARLIVVCATTLLNHIAADFDVYQEALLWKSLREVCSHAAGCDTIDGQRIQVFVPAHKEATLSAPAVA
ncbi:MAG: AAA family ATPase, partial [Chloroflexota bacterium]|nr:AAA family ATPase [Chloroflexota bacterium]